MWGEGEGEFGCFSNSSVVFVISSKMATYRKFGTNKDGEFDQFKLGG